MKQNLIIKSYRDGVLVVDDFSRNEKNEKTFEDLRSVYNYERRDDVVVYKYVCQSDGIEMLHVELEGFVTDIMLF